MAINEAKSDNESRTGHLTYICHKCGGAVLKVMACKFNDGEMTTGEVGNRP